MPRLYTIIALATAAVLIEGADAAPLPRGAGQQTVQLPSIKMEIFTYRPDCHDPSLLLVFHGLNRNAAGYRDYAISPADANCMLVVAPLFDKQRFPTWRYQQGGIVDRREVQNSRTWTGNLVLELAEWARKNERRQMDYYLIGHSAGGQFLSRVAAFVPTDARRIVIANPSTHVFPTLQVAAPFGFGKVYPDASAQAQLRRYLEQPVTIFLGEDDTGDENLNESPRAMAQGNTRYERGLNLYQAGRKLATERRWAFNWRLVELPGVGHSARKMFSSQNVRDALNP